MTQKKRKMRRSKKRLEMLHLNQKHTFVSQQDSRVSLMKQENPKNTLKKRKKNLVKYMKPTSISV